MAYSNGTASNYLDLVGRLRDFIVSDPALVSAGQAWTLLSGPSSGTPAATDELVFSGPGLAGNDDIRVGLKFYANAGLGYYNVGVVGLTTSGVADIETQPGASTPHWMLLLNSPMAYWFIANGRSFKVVVRAGANYPQMYAGFILPEHLPDDWPYPLFVGACAWDRVASNSSDTPSNSAYWNGVSEGTIVTARATGSLCDAGRMWRPVSNRSTGSSDTSHVHTGHWYAPFFNQTLRQSLTDQPILSQGLLFSNDTTIGRNTYGRFDGVFYLPSFGSTPEQVIAVDGTQYLAVPNVFRTTDGDYSAYALA